MKVNDVIRITLKDGCVFDGTIDSIEEDSHYYIIDDNISGDMVVVNFVDIDKIEY